MGRSTTRCLPAAISHETPGFEGQIVPNLGPRIGPYWPPFVGYPQSIRQKRPLRKFFLMLRVLVQNWYLVDLKGCQPLDRF
jgi:hypothetical protein